MRYIFTPTIIFVSGSLAPKQAPAQPFTFKLLQHFFLVLFVSIYVAALPTNAFARDVLADNACPTNLVHYFGFDEEAGGPYLDYTTNTTAGCTNCPTPTPGLFGGAQNFNGNSRVDFEQTRHFQWGPNSSFTIEVWVRTTEVSGTNQVLIGRDAKDSQAHWWLGITPEGNATFVIRDRTGNTMSLGGENEGTINRKINDGNWHHLVVVRNGTTSTKERHTLNKLYVDGMAIYSLEHPFGSDYLSASPVNIGYLDLQTGYPYRGAIDELMVYDRILSEGEVRARYNNGAGSYCGPNNVSTAIVSEPVTHGVAEQNYFYDVNAVGSPAPTYKLLAAPQGMNINSSTGLITWKPTTVGSYTVTVQATNLVNASEQKFTIEVKQGNGEIAEIIHHWMLHEITGSRYRDYYTPHHAEASDIARPTPITGVVSGGQRFDGQDDGLDVLESPHFNWGADADFTIELWMRTTVTPSGNQVLMGRSAKDSPVQWWLGLNPGGEAVFVMFDWNRRGTAVTSTGKRINDGLWHQFVAVRSAGSNSSRLYIDGELAGQQTYQFEGGFASRSPVNLGYLNEASGYRYQGDLDEVKLFGRPLTAVEIKERYTNVYSAITELLSFEGSYAAGSVLLNWESFNEVDVADFEVQRSEDGEVFTSIGSVAAKGPSSDRLPYNYTDTSPLSGDIYYRLKINKTSGRFTFSNIILVRSGGFMASTFLLFPNPTKRGDVQVEVTKFQVEEEVSFVISDLAGKRISQEQVKTDFNGNLNFKVTITDHMRPGIYNLSVISKTKILSRKLVVVE
ncbi:LamG-like jellyroll fold domain-containing protein [Pontibacter qinzhouensis]|nr:LamG-like jellyroll fold domain-containing protein [Pontibacter qinzhouensis]